MATSDILGLFTTPEQYQLAQRKAQEDEASQYARLDPRAKASFGFYRAGQQFGDAIGGALGGVDPQLQKITQRQQLASQLDPSNLQSYMRVAKMAADAGDQEFAMAIAQEARKVQESSAGIELKQAQAFKAKNQQQAQTDSAQKRNIISALEEKLATDPAYKPTQQEIANARFIVATEAKQKSFIDPQTNQLIVIDGLDVNLAAPNIAKLLTQIPATQPSPVTQPVTDATMPATTEAVSTVATPVSPTSSLTSKPLIRIIDTPSSAIKTEERDKKIAAEKEEKTRAVESFDDQISAIQSLRKKIKSTTDIVGPFTTGFGALLSIVPLSKAKTLKGNTKTIKDNVALSKLRELKQQSTTGASGLGALNIKELDLIQGIIGSLDPESENYLNDLNDIDAFFARAEELMKTQSGRAKENLGAPVDNETKIKIFIDYNGGKPTRQQAIKALKKSGVIK